MRVLCVSGCVVYVCVSCKYAYVHVSVFMCVCVCQAKSKSYLFMVPGGSNSFCYWLTQCFCVVFCSDLSVPIQKYGGLHYCDFASP